MLISFLVAIASAASPAAQNAPSNVKQDKVQVCGERRTMNGDIALVRGDGSVAMMLASGADDANLKLVDAMLVGGTKDEVTYCVELEGEAKARKPVSIFQLSCRDPFRRKTL